MLKFLPLIASLTFSNACAQWSDWEDFDSSIDSSLDASQGSSFREYHDFSFDDSFESSTDDIDLLLTNALAQYTVRCYTECGAYRDFSIVTSINHEPTWGDLRKSIHLSLIELFKEPERDSFFSYYWQTMHNNNYLTEAWQDDSIRLELGQNRTKLNAQDVMLDAYLDNTHELHQAPIYFTWNPSKKYKRERSLTI